MENPRFSRFVIVISQAKMPASCKGRYGRIGVVEVDTDIMAERGHASPAFLGDHACGVVEVAETWERLFWGTTEKCAFYRALEDAQKVCDELNAKWYAANPDCLEMDTARSDAA